MSSFSVHTDPSGVTYYTDERQGGLPYSGRTKACLCAIGMEARLACTLDEATGAIDYVILESASDPTLAKYKLIGTANGKPFEIVSDALKNLLASSNITASLSDRDQAEYLDTARRAFVNVIRGAAGEVMSAQDSDVFITDDPTLCFDYGHDCLKEPERSVLGLGAILDATTSSVQGPRRAVAAKSSRDLDRALVIRRDESGSTATFVPNLTVPYWEEHRVGPAISWTNPDQRPINACPGLQVELERRLDEWSDGPVDSFRFLSSILPSLMDTAIKGLDPQV